MPPIESRVPVFTYPIQPPRAITMPRTRHTDESASALALLDDMDPEAAQRIEAEARTIAAETTPAEVPPQDPHQRESGCMPHAIEARFLTLKFGADADKGFKLFAQEHAKWATKIAEYSGRLLSITSLCARVHWRRVILRRWAIVAALAGRLDEVPAAEDSAGVEAWTVTLKHGQEGIDEYRTVTRQIETDARDQVAQGLGGLGDWWAIEVGNPESSPENRRDYPRKAIDRTQRIAEARTAIEAIEADRAAAPAIRQRRLARVFEEHGGSEPLAGRIYAARLLAGQDPEGQQASARLRGLADELAQVDRHLAEAADPLSVVPAWMAERSQVRHDELTDEIAAKRAEVDRARGRSAEALIRRAMAGDDEAVAELLTIDRKQPVSAADGFALALSRIDPEWEYVPRLVELLATGALPEHEVVDRVPSHLPWRDTPSIPVWW